MQKIKTNIEVWLNRKKKIATVIITASCIVAILVTWVGHDNYLEIKNRVILSLETPVAQAKALPVADLSVLEGTPMEDAIPYIRNASNYYNIPVKYYLCVANAESSFKNFTGYNPFGIKPSNQLKQYDSWEHSINGFSQLIKYYYLEEGRITAEQIEPKYVGYPSQEWLNNCNKYLR